MKPAKLIESINAASFFAISLTTLIASHDVFHSTVTNQIAFNQRDCIRLPNLKVMDRHCQVLVLKQETLNTITFICYVI